MSIQLHNSLTKKKEAFTPIVPKRLHMYVCGPTVYNYIHIGNARPLVFFDVVRRFFEYLGYEVKFVLNYTDVEDKIIARAKEEHLPWQAITQKYISAYEADMQSLGIKKPFKQPLVSEHIDQIVQMVKQLIAKGFAYEVSGEVFFNVRSFPAYGKLSGKNVDDLISGSRVEIDQKKKDPLDFSLWKPRKDETEPSWDSPWGKGRPGWHIECSAMSIEYLGETFDIHGGGMDLTHPHHENEIAQSECSTGKRFARYWLHNNMLTVSSEKMSKSLGNIFLTKDFVQTYLAETLKYLLLSGHYRSTIDFSEKNIRDAQSAIHRVYSSLFKAHKFVAVAENSDQAPSTEENKLKEMGEKFELLWKESLEDDLNTAKVMGYVFDYVRCANSVLDKKKITYTSSVKRCVNEYLKGMEKLSGVLNLFGEPPESFLKQLRSAILKERGLDPSLIEEKVKARLNARAQKDFATSDLIRNELAQMGIELMDSPQATDWDVRFN